MPNMLELIGNADEGVFAIDRDQKIILWNSRAQEILGYAPQEVIGRYCYDLIVGRDPDGKVVCDKDCPALQMAKDSGRAPSHYCVMRSKAGKPVWLHITHVVVPSKNEELESLVHIFRDVTEYIEAKDLVQRLLSYLAKSSDTSKAPQAEPSDATKKAAVSLTNREVEVISLLAQGANANAISQKLVISPATARNHIQNILGKLGVHSALEAVAYASRNGLL